MLRTVKISPVPVEKSSSTFSSKLDSLGLRGEEGIEEFEEGDCRSESIESGDQVL
jgi:hypothetical protein